MRKPTTVIHIVTKNNIASYMHMNLIFYWPNYIYTSHVHQRNNFEGLWIYRKSLIIANYCTYTIKVVKLIMMSQNGRAKRVIIRAKANIRIAVSNSLSGYRF